MSSEHSHQDTEERTETSGAVSFGLGVISGIIFLAEVGVGEILDVEVPPELIVSTFIGSMSLLGFGASLLNRTRH